MATYEIHPEPLLPTTGALRSVRRLSAATAGWWSAIRKAPAWATLRNVLSYAADPDVARRMEGRSDPRDDLRFLR